MKITQYPFGEYALFVLTNAHGDRVDITDIGGCIVNWLAPDKQGRHADIVLAHGDVAAYAYNPPYFGAVIARCANRIANARFCLDGTEYRLERNDGKQNIHGGSRGTAFRRFRVDASGGALTLSTHINDMEDGFPGELDFGVTYTLSDDGALEIVYSATTSKTTVMNPTNHTYFNLCGHDAGNVGGHIAQIAADRYNQNNEESYPLGAAIPVAGTRFDFREARLLGDHYDNNFVLSSSPEAGGLRFAARISEPQSGRVLEVRTDMPCVQFYTAGNLPDGTPGKGGAVYCRGGAFCLETQFTPNAINMPPEQLPHDLPLIQTGQRWQSRTIYRVANNGG